MNTAIARRRRSQMGFSLLELSLTLVIGGMAIAGTMGTVVTLQQNADNRILASDALRLSKAAQLYITQNRDSLLALASLAANGDVDEIPVATLQTAGYLPADFPSTNLLGQTYRIFVSRGDDTTAGVSAGDWLYGLVVTSGGTAISDKRGARITAEIGAAGGFVYGSVNTPVMTQVDGAMGTWLASFADWDDADTSVSGSTSPGHISVLTSMLSLSRNIAGGGATSIDELDDGITDYSGTFSVYMGEKSGLVTPTGSMITATGYQAVQNGTGNFSTAFGSQAVGTASATGAGSTAMGALALAATTGADNTGLGARALSVSTAAGNSVALGADALGNFNVTVAAAYNTAIGYKAMYGTGAASTAVNNTAIGSRSLQNLVLGSDNTVIGVDAAAATSTLSQSTIIGNNSLKNATFSNAVANTLIGHNGWTDTGGSVVASNNTIINNDPATACATAGTLSSVTSLGKICPGEEFSTVIGTLGLKINGTTGAICANGTTCTTVGGIAIGNSAGNGLADSKSIAIGYYAGSGSAPAMTDSVAVGTYALFGAPSGFARTTAIGGSAGECWTYGVGAQADNTYIGYMAAGANPVVSGVNCGASAVRNRVTAIGYRVFRDAATTDDNIGIGSQIEGITTGDRNIILSTEAINFNGAGGRPSNPSDRLFVAGTGNSLVLRGNLASGTRYLTLGGTGTEAIGGSTGTRTLYVPDGGILATGYYYVSDRNLKRDIESFTNGTLVDQLRPVSFRWKTDGHRSVGFIAQELQSVLPLAVEEGSIMTANYGILMAPLVAGIQKSQSDILSAQTRAAALERQITDMESLMGRVQP